jgi:folate-binding protein YgfZ
MTIMSFRPIYARMRSALLPQRGLIRISGDDHLPFLQGLVSNDVLKLKPGDATYAALLSPQGKFLHDFIIMATPQGLVLDCEKARMADLLARLKLYKLRSKVVMETLPESVTALWDGDAPAGAFADPRLPQLGWRTIAAVETNATGQEYDRMRIALGVPDGSRDMIVDKSILLEWGFEELHGVDFAKGCYVGQEVTARSKYRGQVKKGVYSVRGEGVLPAAGAAIMSGDMQVGELRSSNGAEGLALLRHEEFAKSGGKLQCGDTVLSAHLPIWVGK